MKTVLLFFLAIIIGTSSLNAQFSSATLQATGLTCAMCSNAVNKALKAVPFVETVKSDIGKSAFNIVFRKDAEINIDALKDAVEDAGFSVGSLKLTGVFNALRVEKDSHVKLGTAYFHFLDTKEQVLDGENTITIVDKNFVTAKQFKKISSTTKMACMQTGKADICCIREGAPANSRVYHATI